jgi:hypothetical protein
MNTQLRGKELLVFIKKALVAKGFRVAIRTIKRTPWGAGYYERDLGIPEGTVLLVTEVSVDRRGNEKSKRSLIGSYPGNEKARSDIAQVLKGNGVLYEGGDMPHLAFTLTGVWGVSE